MKDYTWGKGTVRWIADRTANDSDKTYTVSTGKVVDVRRIYGEISCSASAGNRILGIQIGDGTNPVSGVLKTSAIAANQKGNVMAFDSGYQTVATGQYAPLLDLSTGSANTYLMLGTMWLPAGYTIRIWDTAAIDAAADDLVTIIQLVEYDA